MGKRFVFFGKLVGLVAMMPWPYGLSLTILVYLAIHLCAIADSSILSTVGVVLQYVLPIPIFVGTIISFMRWYQRKKLYIDVYSKNRASSLFEMDWKEFEILVSEYFFQQGYRIAPNYYEGSDGGVDVVVMSDQGRFLVQCKQWKSQKVGVQVVRELQGVISSQNAAGGFVVSAGGFSKDAYEFAKKTNIKLISGKELSVVIRKNNSNYTSNTIASDNEPNSKNCPNCGSHMIVRTASKGSNIGSKFWGCSKYPQCKKTIPI